MGERERRVSAHHPLGAALITAAALLVAGLPAGATAPDDHGPLLSEAVHGARAIEVLGDRVDEAAGRNGMSSTRLQGLLRTDRTAWVDRAGRLFFADTVETAPSPTVTAEPAPTYPLDQTFRLHSLPGSQHTIYLDFNGAHVQDTAWNMPDVGVAERFHPGWSLDGRPGFNATERAAVQSVWQRVSEDYAPFDVDVTTEPPGQAAIDRSGPADPVFGTRALISASRNASMAMCGGGCGGMAYLDVFDLTTSHDYYQPAWILTWSLGDTAKLIAEAVSHEVGHNFGLLHDGTTTGGYYWGRRNWAPIMGAAYRKPIVQWSRGDYPGANNQEDDLAVIAANGAPLRADDAGDALLDAGPVPAGRAYITTATDRDVYALGVCTGTVTLTAKPARRSPDLDIGLTLTDAAGVLVASADPPSGTISADRASGLSAEISKQLSAGAYFVAVDGVGDQRVPSAYDDYGSLGTYRLTQTGCVPG